MEAKRQAFSGTLFGILDGVVPDMQKQSGQLHALAFKSADVADPELTPEELSAATDKLQVVPTLRNLSVCNTVWVLSFSTAHCWWRLISMPVHMGGFHVLTSSSSFSVLHDTHYIQKHSGFQPL